MSEPHNGSPIGAKTHTVKQKHSIDITISRPMATEQEYLEKFDWISAEIQDADVKGMHTHINVVTRNKDRLSHTVIWRSYPDKTEGTLTGWTQSKTVSKRRILKINNREKNRPLEVQALSSEGQG